MTTSHTPGPWVEKHELGKHYSISKNGYWLGRCKGRENARLIAAAPDLLEALKFVMTAHGEQLDLAFEQAQDAIAKAEGKALKDTEGLV